jgi:hypothetical protein
MTTAPRQTARSCGELTAFRTPLMWLTERSSIRLDLWLETGPRSANPPVAKDGPIFEDQKMKIPFVDLKPLLEKYKLRQIIIVAWDGEQVHVATHGATISDGDQAAEGGNLVKSALGWPANLCEDTSARVSELIRILRKWVHADGGGGLHLDGCSSIEGDPCDCGLEEARAAIASATQTTDSEPQPCPPTPPQSSSPTPTQP